jgi:uroporphyrinogen III methyltransferase/synthase
LKGPLLCAIGSATAGRLARHGIKADLLPPEFRAEAVVAALAGRVTLDGARVLLPRSDIGREIIGEQLRDAGAVVTEVIAYRTILEDAPRPGEPDIYGMLLQGHIDVVTFTSASAVRNFARVYGAEQAVDLLKNTVVAAIGPVTGETAVQLGFTVTVQPATYTVPAMVEAIAAHFQTGPLATT